MQSCLGTDYLLNQLYRSLHALRAPESFTRLIQEAAYSSGTGGAFPNATPIWPCPFQIVRAERRDPSLSIRSSNVSGTPKTLGNTRSAPPDDKLRTMQSITEPPPLKTM